MLLQADHVNNDGAEHRKQGNKGLPLYKEMLRVAREEPGRLQLLCANCHLIKTRLESRGWDVFEELMGFDPLLPLPTIRT